MAGGEEIPLTINGEIILVVTKVEKICTIAITARILQTILTSCSIKHAVNNMTLTANFSQIGSR